MNKTIEEMQAEMAYAAKVVERDFRPKSWKPEVQTGSDPKWYGNALRFATKAEAEASANDLAGRWMLVQDWRAVESDDPVNYKWIAGMGLEAVR